MILFRLLMLALAASAPAACRKAEPAATGGPAIIRLGHFANITHAQALVASHLSRQGKGWFESRLGDGARVEYFVYNAGPSAMEGFFTRAIDLAYVGPNPVLNAYDKSRGKEGRVVAGAALGGAALVVPADGRLAKPEDFRGKKVATPQLGNTQDVACRAWLAKHGFRVTLSVGDVFVIPTANPDQLALFQSGKIDAVWTVEPWVTRLETEAGGRVLIEQSDAITTVLAGSTRFLKEQPELLRKFVAAHAELTQWINEHPAEAREMVRAELKEITKRDIPAPMIERAWPRLKFHSEISREQIGALVAEAQSVGFLKHIPDLTPLVTLP